MLPSFEIKDSEEQTTKRIRQEPTETTMGVEVGKSEIEHLQTIGICNNGNDNVKEECNVEEETTGKSKESITLEKGLYFSIMILCDYEAMQCVTPRNI